jgi:hypothetical protein
MRNATKVMKRYDKHLTTTHKHFLIRRDFDMTQDLSEQVVTTCLEHKARLFVISPSMSRRGCGPIGRRSRSATPRR